MAGEGGRDQEGKGSCSNPTTFLSKSTGLPSWHRRSHRAAQHTLPARSHALCLCSPTLAGRSMPELCSVTMALVSCCSTAATACGRA